jgi:hypothetical protein
MFLEMLMVAVRSTLPAKVLIHHRLSGVRSTHPEMREAVQVEILCGLRATSGGITSWQYTKG